MFLSIQCFSQLMEADPPPFRHYTFSKNDGYLIDRLNTMVSDHLGWIWLTGKSQGGSGFQLGTDETKAARF